MSAIQWSGGKLHGDSEAKLQGFLHDTKDTRLIHGHSNPDIDLSRTPNNMSYKGLTYQQKCDRYDELMREIRIKRKSSGANANVTLQQMVIPIPAGMQNGDQYDPVHVQAWVNDVGAILEKEFGNLLIDIDCHVDEVHRYLDPEKAKDDPNRFVWSRIHLHAAVIPAIWETVKDTAGNPVLDSNGEPVKELVLNAHKFARKGVIIRLNRLVQAMTLEKYGMNFMTGAGKGLKHQTVEDLKRRSAKAMQEEGLEAIPDTPKKKKDTHATASKPATNRAHPGPDSPVLYSVPIQDDVGPDPMEYAGRIRRQALEDAKHITDRARDDAARITAAAEKQADALQQITLQSAVARIAQMRARLELEASEQEKEKRKQEQALQDARDTIAKDRVAIDKQKAELEDMRIKLENEQKETTMLLESSRADHQQQRKLNQKAIGTEWAVAERLIALNEREALLDRQERESKPVSTAYNMLKAMVEHENKASNRDNAKALRKAMEIIYNAKRTPGSWLNDTEAEFIRARQARNRGCYDFDSRPVQTRPLPTIANHVPTL